MIVHLVTSAQINMSYTESEDEESSYSKNIWKGERCEPLGAAMDIVSDGSGCNDLAELENRDMTRLHALEEEQEVLSSSLFSLTSHLAQVQFRLRQIVDAPADEKESMLKTLEEFTFQGVPELRHQVDSKQTDEEMRINTSACVECKKLDEKIKEQRLKQKHFIDQLKSQLKELERFTSETNSVCSGESFHKQKMMIDDLKLEIDQSLKENFHQPLNADEVRHQINCAVRQFVNRQISKDEIVDKLQAQVNEMQQFIQFLQSESLLTASNGKKKNPKTEENVKLPSSPHSKTTTNDDLRAETVNLMRRVASLLQMFASAQFGCSSRTFQKNNLKTTNIINHWGDMRAKLEMSIDAVLNLVTRINLGSSYTLEDYDSESEENTLVLNNVPLTTAVRKHLAVNLRDLMQHGLMMPDDTTTVVPFIGCFPIRRHSSARKMHIWELILRYYDINNGECFNSTPARKLSQSFNLDIVGGTAISNKQSLLGAIGSIMALHQPYKRNYDAHFKALVCAALNSHKLVIWLNMIFKNRSLVDIYYSQTSYIVNTGFQDSLHSLDRLTQYKFDLPVDLAVRQFQNIKDAFI